MGSRKALEVEHKSRDLAAEQAGSSALSPLVVEGLLISPFCTAVCVPAQLIYTNTCHALEFAQSWVI